MPFTGTGPSSPRVYQFHHFDIHYQLQGAAISPLVRLVGLEPTPPLQGPGSEPGASTNFTTTASSIVSLLGASGVRTHGLFITDEVPCH